MKNKKDTVGYTRIPTALSLNILKKILDDKEFNALTQRYIIERNKGLKKRVPYCPNCGFKIPIFTPDNTK